MPTLYIIAGCNGAGKTTASMTLLPEILHCKEFVNADSIAAGLSPFHPEAVSFEAGRLMLKRITQLIKEEKTFAFETTLSSKIYVQLVDVCMRKGYKVELIFFWLSSVKLAKERIRERVKRGGHFIPNDVVKRRYYRGLINFFELYSPIVSSWRLINNSKEEPVFIATGGETKQRVVLDEKNWIKIRKSYDKKYKS